MQMWPMWVIAWNALNSHLSNRELRQCGDRSRRKENRSSLRLVPATLCLFPRCVDVCIYIYILVSLPRADIIVLRVLEIETDTSKGNKLILLRREKFPLFKLIIRIDEFPVNSRVSSFNYRSYLDERTRP